MLKTVVGRELVINSEVIAEERDLWGMLFLVLHTQNIICTVSVFGGEVEGTLTQINDG